MWLWRRAGRAGSGARRLRGSLATVSVLSSQTATGDPWTCALRTSRGRVAALVAWVLGPNWGFVTRAEFVTDGGMARKMIYTK